MTTSECVRWLMIKLSRRIDWHWLDWMRCVLLKWREWNPWRRMFWPWRRLRLRRNHLLVLVTLLVRMINALVVDTLLMRLHVGRRCVGQHVSPSPLLSCGIGTRRIHCTEIVWGCCHIVMNLLYWGENEKLTAHRLNARFRLSREMSWYARTQVSQVGGRAAAVKTEGK